MRGALVAVTVCVALMALVGCSEAPSRAGQSGSPSVTLTFDGDEAPTPERVEAAVGEEIEVVVKSDTAGTLHLHTEPEQELDYGPGTTTLMLTVGEPGVVEVESHELGTVVLQLEVR